MGPSFNKNGNDSELPPNGSEPLLKIYAQMESKEGMKWKRKQQTTAKLF